MKEKRPRVNGFNFLQCRKVKWHLLDLTGRGRWDRGEGLLRSGRTRAARKG